MKVPEKFQEFEEQPLFPDAIEPKVPPLSFILNMPPTAHKETKFNNRSGHAYSDNDKRQYMIEAANSLREYEGWFKGCRYLQLTVVFVTERPGRSHGIPMNTGIPGRVWREPHTEIFRCSPPDLDNFEKSLQDILSNHVIQRKTRSKSTYRVIVPEVKGAGIIDDDSRIVAKTTYKIYATRANPSPRIEITIRQRSHLFKRKSKKK